MPTSTSGCRLKGCLVVLSFLFVLLGAGGIGGYWYYSSQLEKYTASVPVVIPTIEYAPEQIEKLEAEIETFRRTIEQEQPKRSDHALPDLVLSADEINALISQHPQLKGCVHLEILDDKIVGDVSVPTDGLPGGEGRFFNAKVTFDLSIEDSLLNIRLEEATVNGEAVPSSVLRTMADQNLTSQINSNPDAADWIARFESLTIKDGKVILTPKPKPKPLANHDPEAERRGDEQAEQYSKTSLQPRVAAVIDTDRNGR